MPLKLVMSVFPKTTTTEKTMVVSKFTADCALSVFQLCSPCCCANSFSPCNHSVFVVSLSITRDSARQLGWRKWCLQCTKNVSVTCMGKSSIFKHEKCSFRKCTQWNSGCEEEYRHPITTHLELRFGPLLQHRLSWLTKTTASHVSPCVFGCKNVKGEL